MGQLQDLTGQTFGQWTVLHRAESKILPSGQRQTMWRCRCVCGTERDVSAKNLVSGGSTSCGCITRETISKRLQKDLTGQRFGYLTVLQRLPKAKPKERAKYVCLCDCGKKTVVQASNLTTGSIKSCGCKRWEMVTDATRIDLTGQRYGKLTVLSPVDKRNNKWRWLCRCDCGKETIVSGQSLRRGSTQSCGCLAKEELSKRNLLDLTGMQFGHLTALQVAEAEQHGNGRTYSRWVCRCECGKEIIVTTELLRSGKKTHCGCKTTKTMPSERTGQKQLMSCGLSATILDGTNAKDMTIIFEDGVKKEHVSYNWFKKGTVKHPLWTRVNPVGNTYHGFCDIHFAYRTNDGIYYYCQTPDGRKDILSPHQMLIK